MFCNIRKYVGRVRNYFRMVEKRHKLTQSKEFHAFKNNNEKKKIILLDTPEHGNLGDQAIAVAECFFLQKECGIKKFYEFSRDEYCAVSQEIGNYINERDVICIHGGGFVGTIWQNEEDMFLQILQQFQNNTIIVFPQTIYFEDSDFGRREEKRLRMTIEKCTDLTIFVRDKRSYDFCLQRLEMDSKHCFCVPDIATYLHFNQASFRMQKVLLCLRRDKEKKLNERQLFCLRQWLRKRKYKILYTDTVINKRISKERREKLVNKKLGEFSRASLIITDRLHGMLFAALSGTPCIAVDNISKKVSGAYAWIQHLNYVRHVEIAEINENVIEEMLRTEGNEYSNYELRHYYDVMKNIVVEAFTNED